MRKRKRKEKPEGYNYKSFCAKKKMKLQKGRDKMCRNKKD